MNDMVSIYALCDQDGEIRYIGKANNVANRLAGHMREVGKRDYPVYRWIAKNGRPKVIVLHVCEPDEDWRDVEKRLIAEARARGERLLNIADGGDEPYCPTEVRARNGRKAAISRANTPEKTRSFFLKRELGMLIKRGHLNNARRQRLRALGVAAPHVWGTFAAIPDRVEDEQGRGRFEAHGKEFWV
jgi:predicted GIY-YIG superfamily endonuclease